MNTIQRICILIAYSTDTGLMVVGQLSLSQSVAIVLSLRFAGRESVELCWLFNRLADDVQSCVLSHICMGQPGTCFSRRVCNITLCNVLSNSHSTTVAEFQSTVSTCKNLEEKNINFYKFFPFIYCRFAIVCYIDL